MLPVLELAGDGQEHKYRDAVEALATQFGLSEDERGELLPSGTQPVFDNRVGWAKSYLKQAGLVEAPKRGYFRITEAGKSLLGREPMEINNSLLAEYPAFQAFKKRKRKQKPRSAAVSATEEEPAQATPDDRLAAAYRTLRAEVEANLLDQIMALSPAFFERLVVDLLVKMGYGGNREDAGRAIGQTNDGGIVELTRFGGQSSTCPQTAGHHAPYPSRLPT